MCSKCDGASYPICRPKRHKSTHTEKRNISYQINYVTKFPERMTSNTNKTSKGIWKLVM